MGSTFFSSTDFTRDGLINFGKFRGKPVSSLPERYFQALVAHYQFNLTILSKYRTRQPEEPKEVVVQ
jgi:hypothetical protein